MSVFHLGRLTLPTPRQTLSRSWFLHPLMISFRARPSHRLAWLQSNWRWTTFKEDHMVTIRHEQNSPSKNHKFLHGGRGGFLILSAGRNAYCWSVLPPCVIQRLAVWFQLLTRREYLFSVQLKIPCSIGPFSLSFALNFAHRKHPTLDFRSARGYIFQLDVFCRSLVPNARVPQRLKIKSFQHTKLKLIFIYH